MFFLWYEADSIFSIVIFFGDKIVQVCVYDYLLRFTIFIKFTFFSYN